VRIVANVELPSRRHDCALQPARASRKTPEWQPYRFLPSNAAPCKAPWALTILVFGLDNDDESGSNTDVPFLQQGAIGVEEQTVNSGSCAGKIVESGLVRLHTL